MSPIERAIKKLAEQDVPTPRALHELFKAYAAEDPDDDRLMTIASALMTGYFGGNYKLNEESFEVLTDIAIYGEDFASGEIIPFFVGMLEPDFDDLSAKVWAIQGLVDICKKWPQLYLEHTIELHLITNTTGDQRVARAAAIAMELCHEYTRGITIEPIEQQEFPEDGETKKQVVAQDASPSVEPD